MQVCMAIPNSSMWPYLVVGLPTLALELEPCWAELLAAGNTTPLWFYKENIAFPTHTPFPAIGIFHY